MKHEPFLAHGHAGVAAAEPTALPILHGYAADESCSVELIDRRSIDATLVTDWLALARVAVEPNIFLSPHMLVPALEQFDREGTAKLCLVRNAVGDLVGIMPLERRSHYGRWPVPHLALWTHPNQFLSTPLVAAGYEERFWQALFAKLDRQPQRALFLHLEDQHGDGPVAKAMRSYAGSRNRPLFAVERIERAMLVCNGDPESYYVGAVRGKKRKELRRQRARLEDEGDVTLEAIEGEDGLSSWTDEFLTLEKRGWKGANGSALACASSTETYFRDSLANCAAAGKLQRRALRLDGRAIAMLVNILDRPGCFSFKTAFDEDYARFSPGVLLQLDNLDLMTRDDIDWADSCAAQDHPMIDSLWTGRRSIVRYSVAIGGAARRGLFNIFGKTEQKRMANRTKDQ